MAYYARDGPTWTHHRCCTYGTSKTNRMFSSNPSFDMVSNVKIYIFALYHGVSVNRFGVKCIAKYLFLNDD